MKLKEREKAIAMRKQGLSYSKILEQIPVAKSTISLWLRDIKLTTRQEKLLLIGREKSRYAGAKAQQRKRIERTQEIVKTAKREFTLLHKNPLFPIGLMLYWAEGDKHKAERVKFTNSDPILISLMMKWFRKICKVPESKFRIALHIHDLHIQRDVLDYWSNLTNIPSQQFQKVYIKKSSLRHRRNVLYNGTCGIVVSDRNLFRKISGWKLGLLEYFHISP